tara:strand:+ start:1608 stop:3146 length:1539 start_codon:yes stop_codon:yes gene_type:complete
MSNTICSSNITSGFIDLATYDELEKYMYGCGDAVAYFVRTTCKSTWFTQVPVILSNASGQADFGRTWSVSISRAGDYLLQTWLRVGLPEVRVLDGGDNATLNIRWTRNFMHNLIQDCCITFNDLVAARFDNHHLDFWAAFTVPASKQVAYDNMIGNTAALTGGSDNFLPARVNNSNNPNPTALLPRFQTDRTWLNLPLPFFYSRDSGVALPTAALPYNEMRINFQFRNWWELLVVEDTNAAAALNAAYRVNTDQSGSQLTTMNGSSIPSLLGYVQVWANYAIVSNDERKRMACAPRDILIEQAQMANTQTVTPASVRSPSIDLRLSHAIKVLFFAVKNVTHTSEHSTYTVGSPEMGLLENNLTKFSGQYQLDPVDRVSLVYENTNRLGQMGADYFTMVNPYFHAPSVPVVNGYHSYSYSLDFICLDPMGSTNYGKLTNVSIMPEFTGLAVGANGANGTAQVATLPLGFNAQPVPNQPNGSGVQRQQSYLFVLTCVNNNIIRISGGALGFPVL